jgi:hypothetical protein
MLWLENRLQVGRLKVEGCAPEENPKGRLEIFIPRVVSTAHDA